MWQKVERWLTLLATLCAIVPALYAAWTFFAKGDKPRLTYVIDPSRSIVADPGLTSRLRVLLDDNDLQTRVYLTQIMLFNDSAIAVEPKDMLAPLTIDVTPRSEYIDVRIVKQSTPELMMHVARDKAGRATLPIRPAWQILQHYDTKTDAAVLQIVHTGNPRIVVRGSHRLQRRLRTIPLDRDAKLAALRNLAPALSGLVILAFLALVWILFTANRSARIAAGAVFFVVIVTALWLVLHILITPDLPLSF